MNCDKYIENINLLIDGNLNKQKTAELKEHMKTCESCRKEYEELKSLKDMLGELEMKKLPENFEKELKIKLLEAKEEKESNKKSLMKNLLDKFSNSNPKYKLAVSIGMVAVVAVIGIAGLGIGGMGSMNSSKSFDTAAPEAAMYMENEAATDYEIAETEESMNMVRSGEVPKLAGGFGNDGVEVESNVTSEQSTLEENKFVGRLIIKNADITVEVQDFDGFMETITEIVTESKGYISNSSSYVYKKDSSDPTKNLKGGNVAIRVPSEIFDGIIYSVGEIGNVTNTNLYTEDISKRYRDTADEVKNLEIREERIREIMGKAEKIEDILKIEEELSRVRSEINRLKGNLSNWEDLVSLSTININVREVEDIKNQIVPVNTNVFQKAKEGFIETINRMIKSIERFFVYVVTNLPVIVPVLIIGIIIIRKLRKMNIF